MFAGVFLGGGGSQWRPLPKSGKRINSTTRALLSCYSPGALRLGCFLTCPVLSLSHKPRTTPLVRSTRGSGAGEGSPGAGERGAPVAPPPPALATHLPWLSSSCPASLRVSPGKTRPSSSDGASAPGRTSRRRRGLGWAGLARTGQSVLRAGLHGPPGKRGWTRVGLLTPPGRRPFSGQARRTQESRRGIAPPGSLHSALLRRGSPRAVRGESRVERGAAARGGWTERREPAGNGVETPARSLVRPPALAVAAARRGVPLFGRGCPAPSLPAWP